MYHSFNLMTYMYMCYMYMIVYDQSKAIVHDVHVLYTLFTRPNQ